MDNVNEEKLKRLREFFREYFRKHGIELKKAEPNSGTYSAILRKPKEN